jgi:hypothetical protein
MTEQLGVRLWWRPDLGPVPVHVEYAYPPRPSAASPQGADHVIVDGALLAGRLIRDHHDALCKPRAKFWGLYPMDSQASCTRCCQMLAKLHSAGLVEQPIGDRTARQLPCLAWNGLQHDRNSTGWIWSSLDCQTCGWPLDSHALLARAARFTETYQPGVKCRLAVWPIASEVRPAIHAALLQAVAALITGVDMPAPLRGRISREAVEAAIKGTEAQP